MRSVPPQLPAHWSSAAGDHCSVRQWWKEVTDYVAIRLNRRTPCVVLVPIHLQNQLSLQALIRMPCAHPQLITHGFTYNLGSVRLGSCKAVACVGQIRAQGLRYLQQAEHVQASGPFANLPPRRSVRRRLRCTRGKQCCAPSSPPST